MTKREYNAVAGRFLKVEDTADYVIIGLIGSLWYHDLTRDQLNHIKGFCRLSNHRHTLLAGADYQAPINTKMFNNYIRIEKASPAPAWMNKYQKQNFESACLKISSVQSSEELESVIRYIDDYYGEEVLSAAREYMNC